VQSPITRVHLDVHHVPALKVNVAGFPFLAFLVALEDEAALACSDKHQNLFAHDCLLSSKTEKMF
jgi:hypothetical protein